MPRSRKRHKCSTKWRHVLRKPERKSTHGYNGRKKSLKKLGFDSYAEYLASYLWKVVREAKLAVDSNCELCGVEAVQVHHLSYDVLTLAGKKRETLVSICDPCHKKIEFNENGTKRKFGNVVTVTKAFLAVRKLQAIQ